MSEMKNKTPFGYFVQGLKNIGKFPFLLIWAIIRDFIKIVWGICVACAAYCYGIVLLPVWGIRALGGDPNANWRMYSYTLSRTMLKLFNEGVYFISEKIKLPPQYLGGYMMSRITLFLCIVGGIISLSLKISVVCEQERIERVEYQKLEKIRKEDEKKKFEKDHPLITETIKAAKYLFNK